MIISCENCNKKFDIKSELIPNEGRLLQCSSCNHKWFFQEVTIQTPTNEFKNDEVKSSKNTPVIKKILSSVQETVIPSDTKVIIDQAEKSLSDEKLSIPINSENIIDQAERSFPNNKINNRKIGILTKIIIFIISFVALVILIDTFKYPISEIFPNIEFILYNLYESIKDIKLFFNDLI